MSVLRLERVSYRYAQQRAGLWGLRDVSLEVGNGECLLISGPSGAGKTTLLRCMNGLIPHFFPGQYTGCTLLLGEETTRLSLAALATRVGTVFQNAEAQLLTTTVEAEVAFGVENLGIPPAAGRSRCESAMQRAGIDHLRGRLVSTLSGGEKQRVAIASVLAMRPPVLLFDEPLSNVDPLGAQQFLAQLTALRAAGCTIVVVEQRVRHFFGLVDRLIWLDDQQVVYDGALADSALVRLSTREARPGGGRGAMPARRGPYAVNGHAARGHEVCVEFDRVAFRYPHGPDVLRNVTLRLAGGWWVSVVGKNGIGKTTLAKLTNGLLRPTGGRISVCGLDTSRHPVRMLSKVVGYVFQNPLHALYALTIAEEVSFYPRNQGWPPDRVRRSVGATLAALGLAARATDSPFILSAGEQQRVSIAAVLAGEPQVLILDEPTLGMARADLDTLLALSARLTAAGRLLITITHDLDLVRQSDRVVVLADGEVYADGAPHEVLTRDFVDAVFAR